MGFLGVIGGVLVLAGAVWIIIKAFRTSAPWGVACLLLPFITLAFALIHWRDTKPQLGLYVVGWGLIVLPHLLKG